MPDTSDPIGDGIPGLATDRSLAGTYDDLPFVVEVEVDGPLRVVRLNRIQHLNAFDGEMLTALADGFALIHADPAARAGVLTGNGRAFSIGIDLDQLDALIDDRDLRQQWLEESRRLVLTLVRCRVPVIAAVNGPAIGLGGSLVALSDISFMAETAYLADSHLAMGLIASLSGPVMWPHLTSLSLAKEISFTGGHISAERAARIGLVNDSCPDDQVLDHAIACARRVATLPQQSTEDAKRLLNLHLETTLLETLDVAAAAAERSFESAELRANVARLRAERAHGA